MGAVADGHGGPFAAENFSATLTFTTDYTFRGTTFSDEDYYILTSGFGGVSGKQAAAVDFYLETRLAGRVFVQSAAVAANSVGSNWNITFTTTGKFLVIVWIYINIMSRFHCFHFRWYTTNMCC